MKKLIRKTGELHFIDADRENRCSIYLCIDYTALDQVSFIYCNAVDARRAKKSIRLEAAMPMAVFPNHPCFSRTNLWNIKEDGRDQILMNLLAGKNSMFPAHTSWERIRIVYLKRDRTYGCAWWQVPWDNYQLPDYTHLRGTRDWRRLDNDPDDAWPVSCSLDLNMAIDMTPLNTPGLLVYDDASRNKARRVARLSLFAPQYLPYTSNHYTGFKEIWSLAEYDMKKIRKILKKRSNFTRKGGSKWLDGLSGLKIYMDDPAVLNGLEIPDYSHLPCYNPFPGAQVPLM